MKRKKSFIGASLGTMLEFYDHSLFMIFLPILSPLFFPAQNNLDSLIHGYFLLFIASIARPLGGLYFGHYGDTHGRKKVLLMSIFGVAISTFAIGILPTVASIGIWATIAILCLKTIQVFCFGGEFNNAGIYVVELASPQNEGKWSGLLVSMTLLGSLLAAAFGYLFTLPDAPNYLWRVAFLLGGIFGFFSLGFRKSMHETLSLELHPQEIDSLKQLVRKNWFQLITTIFIGGVVSIPFVTLLSVINPLMVTSGILKLHDMMLLQGIFSFIAMIAAVIAGIFADRFTSYRVVRNAGASLVFLTYPLLYILNHFQSIAVLLIVGAILIVINQMLLGPINAYLKNLFSPTLRCRAISFSYCLGTSIIGGITPIIETMLFRHSKSFATIALWPIGIGFIAYLLISHQTNQEIQNKLLEKLPA